MVKRFNSNNDTMIKTHPIFDGDSRFSIKSKELVDLLNGLHEENERLKQASVVTPEPEPFNHERALAGDAVMTRGGKDVTEMHYFETYSGHWPWTGIVDGDRLSFTRNGRILAPLESPHENDLFMKPKGVYVWLIIYDNGSIKAVTSIPEVALPPCTEIRRIWVSKE